MAQAAFFMGNQVRIVMYELGIEDGNVYVDGSFHKMNIYTENGRIALLSDEKQACENKLSADGKYVLPGFIDPHVHFALGVGENISQDDFYAGSLNAALGGVTTYIDFLDPVKTGEQIGAEFNKRSEMAEKSIVDYAFHTTIANPTDSPEEIFDRSLSVGINSVKLFTTYADTDRRTYDDYIYKLLCESRKKGGIVVIHAENDDLIEKRKDIPVKDHSNSRPVLSENVEVMKLSQMAQASGGHLYIVHVSAGSSAALIKKNFGKELKNHQIILESCPHYFLLNDERLADPDGYKYTMTPPLRPERDRLLLNENIDAISTIGTDHCPYSKHRKEHEFTSEIPMGIGGIRYSFLNMYGLYGFDILPKFTTGPAHAYGLKSKGEILPGMDADIVIFNDKDTTVVNDEMSVYNGKKLKGRIETVFSRGTVVADDGRTFDHKGSYIRRGELRKPYEG